MVTPWPSQGRAHAIRPANRRVSRRRTLSRTGGTVRARSGVGRPTRRIASARTSAAAYTKVDDAENHEDEAYGVNANGAANLAIAEAENNATLVQISTDYVFDGTNAGGASRFDFTQAIFSAVGLDPDRVTPTDSSQFILPAPWPEYSVLGHNASSAAELSLCVTGMMP